MTKIKCKVELYSDPTWHPTYLLSNLLIQSEAREYRQCEDHHGQTVVSQEVDQSAIERLHIVLQQQTVVT